LLFFAAAATSCALLLATTATGCVETQTLATVKELCGNGTVEPGEECDDGNDTVGDGCSSSCTIEPPPEICENSVDDDGDGLVDCADPDCENDPACSPPICGDGALDPGEECDDGNDTDGDGCSSSCTIEPTETICDDRIDEDGDGLVDCADPDCENDPFCLCGNGILEGNEECDDGNNTDGDGCSSSCTLENPQSEVCDNSMDDDSDGMVDCADPDCQDDPYCLCGNGVVDPGESCDDGDGENTDSCPDDPSTGGTCQPAACGDGHLYQGVEECDTTNLGGETCQTLGYSSGALSCQASCTFDVSGCS
jgi:cysteine-rich repeat protein